MLVRTIDIRFCTRTHSALFSLQLALVFDQWPKLEQVCDKCYIEGAQKVYITSFCNHWGAVGTFYPVMFCRFVANTACRDETQKLNVRGPLPRYRFCHISRDAFQRCESRGFLSRADVSYANYIHRACMFLCFALLENCARHNACMPAAGTHQ